MTKTTIINPFYNEWVKKLSITQLHQELDNMLWCSEFGIESKNVSIEKEKIVKLELDKRNDSKN